MNRLSDTGGLIPQGRAFDGAKEWHRDALSDIEGRLTDARFPCVFSRNAFRKGLLKFIFVEDAEEYSIQLLSEGLKFYVELSRQWDGSLDTTYPLIVLFSFAAVTENSVDGYQDFGWQVLQRLHEIDSTPWPEEVGVDPNSETWSMCFNGMPLFVNMSSPVHEARRSRNLGRNFALVINPRERFDVFAGATPSGRKVRANIRHRVGRYDGIPHSPQLGSFGSGALEWAQYGLPEENVARTDRCSFVVRNEDGGSRDD
ncbi:YqcI/YcgG family protein [Streptomyces sp. NPDC050256]|uniref:YqcI/YcgG family protein n=1 Tax=unclassified Streptomyces TaxID=2593676 RepID=UPI003798AF55